MKKYLLAAVLIVLSIFSQVSAQNREIYFNETPQGMRRIKPCEIALSGYNRNQIAELVKKYVKSKNYKFLKQGPMVSLSLRYRTTRVIPEPLRNDTIIYRSFGEACSVEKCYSRLMVLAYIKSTIDDNKIKITTVGGEIYSLSYKSENTKVTMDDYNKLISNDQPVDSFVHQLTYKNKKNKIRKFLDERDFLAYPEAIYDPNGKVINPTNKAVLENYYNNLFYDFIDYLTAQTKK